MTSSYTVTNTFTRVHAHYLASKVAADLRLCRTYYGRPSEQKVDDYVEELTELLAGGYVATFEFGFKSNGARVVSCFYTVTAGGDLAVDDNAGRVFSRAEVTAASFYTYLNYTAAWWTTLTQEQRDKIERGLPIKRSTGPEPADGAGYWVADKTYTAQGTSLVRRTFRPGQ